MYINKYTHTHMIETSHICALAQRQSEVGIIFKNLQNNIMTPLGIVQTLSKYAAQCNFTKHTVYYMMVVVWCKKKKAHIVMLLSLCSFILCLFVLSKSYSIGKCNLIASVAVYNNVYYFAPQRRYT